MGRGRAKAKQTKVARELKYHSPDINYERLQAEVSGGSHRSGEDPELERDHDSEDDDPYDSGGSGRTASR
jgi:hypothetical protein